MSRYKYILWITVLTLLYGCANQTLTDVEIIEFVPANAAAILKIQDFETFKSDLKNNGLLNAIGNSETDNFLSEQSPFLNYLQPTSEVLLCYSKMNDTTAAYTLITRVNDGLISLDSVQNKTVESIAYGNKQIQRVDIEGNISYSTQVDSIFLASSSQLLLENLLDGIVLDNKDFRKVVGLNESADILSIFKNNNITSRDSTNINFASWAAVETEILSSGITATGVVLARDTVPQLLRVFECLIPQQNEIANLLPAQAKNALTFTFNDATLLINNLQNYRGQSTGPVLPELFGSVNEICDFELSQGRAIALKSIDATLTIDGLLPFISEGSTFREVVLKSFSRPNLFSDTFNPLLPKTEYNLMFQLNDFFVFTENEETAQQIISAYKNNSTIVNTGYYSDSSDELSSASSLLLYKFEKAIPESIAHFLNSTAGLSLTNQQLSDYPFAVVQFSYDRDFAHINLVCKEATKARGAAGTVSEEFTVQFEQEILGDPQLFNNHRTNGKDVVVQDVGNKLYLISATGKILWSRVLDGPILGNIQEVDLLRNGKKQLTFTTEHQLYVIDRNGKDVRPFPLKFNDKITQGLSLFDYDNNRKYRFVVVQGDDVFMYDSKGKTVKGFTFKKAKSDIVLPPQHIRMNNKDYIVIAEENGTLNILSRVGKSRVNVSQKFDFSEIPIAKEANNFVVITEDKTKISISQSGKISSQTLNVSDAYWFTVLGRTKVTLDDNLLRINGKLTELPFGIYTKPQIYRVNRNILITVTEVQENKVYVIDDSGNIQSGFPVYGSSICDLGSNSKNDAVIIVVKGAEKEIVLYQIQ